MKFIFYSFLSFVFRLNDLDIERSYIYQDFNPYTGKQLLVQNPSVEMDWFKDLQFAFADKSLNLTMTSKGSVIEEVKTGFIRSFTFESSSLKHKLKGLVYAAMEYNIPRLKVEKIIKKAGFSFESLGIIWNL